jgi:hypothetical protein
MAAVEPSVILRMGTHAEKDYFSKTIHLFDGIILGANLVEATPGASASLLVRFAGQKKKVPFYLDPMTYAFGSYIDDNGKHRSDLDWIKSDQTRKRKGGGKETFRDFKRSYRGLAEQIGEPLQSAVAKSAAIPPQLFDDEKLTRAFCKRIIDYQIQRIQEIIGEDTEFKEYAVDAPKPAVVFAPYFYIDPTNVAGWVKANLALARASTAINPERPVHIVLCADSKFLTDQPGVQQIVGELPKTGAAGVWLWFSGLVEEQSDGPELAALKSLVEKLSASVDVYNMHGGYLSLALSRFGMRGISHGVGYGEQKGVLPVIGQSTPMVRYYLPDVHKRFGVPDIQRCFKALGIETPKDFHEKVCDCVICKGIVVNEVDEFRAFGEMHKSTPSSKRFAQTPSAAKRCRFHFLLNRAKELRWMKTATVADIVGELQKARDTWGKQMPRQSDLTYLGEWQSLLAPPPR